METTSMTVATVLETIGTATTEVISIFGEVGTFIVSNPLMFVGIAIPAATALIWGGYKLAKRALKRK